MGTIIRKFVAATAVLVAVAACGDTASTTTGAPRTASTTSTTSPPATTTLPTTTTIAPTTSVSVSIPPPPPDGLFAVGTPSLFPPDPLPGSDGAYGSGCSPGEGDLPDGAWFGFVRGHGAIRIDFDLACFYFGDLAATKAAEEGEEAPGGFYISNQNPALRRVDLDSATPVHWIVAPPDADLTFETASYVDWVDDPEGYSNCPGDFCAVWLYVNGGTVTEIIEQYLP